MFRMLGILVFVIAIIKFVLPLILAGIIGTAIYVSAQSEQQQENKQQQSKEYKTIKIGNQTLMSENLNYNVTGSKCYKNNPKNCAKCGRLYDWSTAKNACPQGWRLPTSNEWKILASNAGFSALTCGYGTADGNFYNFSNYSYWWSASEKNFNNAYFLSIDDNGNVHRNHLDKNLLFSVRCVKN